MTLNRAGRRAAPSDDQKIYDGGWALLPIRLLVGYGFAAHGYAKLASGPAAFADILDLAGRGGIPHPDARVTEYLDGTLPAKDRERFDQHLATCPPCTAYLAEIKTTLELASELGTAGAPVDDEVAKQLGDMFRGWHGKREP